MAKLDKTKSRLGRGLSSLLSMPEPEQDSAAAPLMLELPTFASTEFSEVVETQSADGVRVQLLLTSAIVPNPHQPRRVMDDATIADLAASLKTTGLIQPIVVRPVGDGYQLIAGERRLRAAKIAELERIPAIVRHADAAEQAQMALVENIQREDLNPVDRAQSYRALMDQLGLTQNELAQRLGEERSGIANYLRILSLSELVRSCVRSGDLSFGHAKLLASVEDIPCQERLAAQAVAGGFSVRTLERLISQAAQGRVVDLPTPPATAHLRDLELSLSRQLGIRVQVKTTGKQGKGKVVLNYGTLDQFDDLLRRLGVTVE